MLTLADYSVKFGRDPAMGLEGKNVFPFFYSLVNHNDIDWTVGLTPPDLSTYAILCKAGVVTPHYVRLDPDYNYKLIAIKYSVCYKDGNHYDVYENVVTDGGVLNPTYPVPPYPVPRAPMPVGIYLPDSCAGTPYSRYIQTSLSVQGSGSQTLFGGQVAGYNMTGEEKIPLAVECMQGYEYGFQALRCEYIMPMQAILSFEFTNTHASRDLYVAAMMYGFKIRL